MRESASARALVLERPRRLVLHEISLPAVGDDDALVRVQACGLCGTDHEQYTGELAGGFAFVPGHETVGIIETIGTAWATTLPSVFLRSSRKGSRIVTSSGS
jgi:alcohol dehydrogenase